MSGFIANENSIECIVTGGSINLSPKKVLINYNDYRLEIILDNSLDNYNLYHLDKKSESKIIKQNNNEITFHHWYIKLENSKYNFENKNEMLNCYYIYRELVSDYFGVRLEVNDNLSYDMYRVYNHNEKEDYNLSVNIRKNNHNTLYTIRSNVIILSLDYITYKTYSIQINLVYKNKKLLLQHFLLNNTDLPSEEIKLKDDFSLETIDCSENQWYNIHNKFHIIELQSLRFEQLVKNISNNIISHQLPKEIFQVNYE